jgi:hypothetical protein
MTTNDNENYAKLCFKFYCENCDYGTSKKSSFVNHCKSNKHNNKHKNNANYAFLCHQIYTCDSCEKTFKDRAGLWRHKKNCVCINKDELLLQLLKQNTDLQNKLIELSKEKTIINSNNTTTNSFNLNFFLNETCKNAMNITDFVSSIQLSVDDLENTGRKGYIEGISNIIVKNLNNIEECFRPIHCSDFKREILYIKDNDKWEKETEKKPILTKAIKTIANENIKQIQKWTDKYPDCTESQSTKNDLYLKIVSNSMAGGSKEECDKNLNKIINNVAKHTIIQKL